MVEAVSGLALGHAVEGAVRCRLQCVGCRGGGVYEQGVLVGVVPVEAGPEIPMVAAISSTPTAW